MTEIYVVLHNIRSVFNVGSIFRTADALGVSGIILSGYTPLPQDRFGNPRKDFVKTALGSEKTVWWKHVEKPGVEIEKFRVKGYRVVGIEQDSRSVDYKALTLSGKVVLVLGNEVRGMSRSLRNRCDDIVEIPMRGKKESLNVAISFGIASFRMFNR